MSKTCSGCKKIFEDIEKNFWKHDSTKDKFQHECINCCKQRRKFYLKTEKGFLKTMYLNIKHKLKGKRYKNYSEEQKEKHLCKLSEEEFLNLWEEHKKQFGYRCRLTGVEMICQSSDLLNFKRAAGNINGYPNALSVDRLDPNKCYDKDNTIFVTNKVNKMKGSVTKELCLKILELYKEKGL
jgi:hypothetical protein